MSKRLKKLLPTPQASDYVEGARTAPNSRQVCLGRELRRGTLLPTVTQQDSRIGPENIGGSQHRAERGSIALADVALGLTQMLPTPKERDWKGQTQRGIHAPQDSLCNIVKLYPTPDTQCHKNARAPENVGTLGGKNQSELQGVVAYLEGKGTGAPLTTAQNNGQLNPNWVEWLMGFPAGWTDLNASGTP